MLFFFWRIIIWCRLSFGRIHLHKLLLNDLIYFFELAEKDFRLVFTSSSQRFLSATKIKFFSFFSLLQYQKCFLLIFFFFSFFLYQKIKSFFLTFFFCFFFCVNIKLISHFDILLKKILIFFCLAFGIIK